MKILLAVDLSPASGAAVDEAAARPWPAGSSFELVSAIEPSHLWPNSEVAQEAAGRAQGLIDQMVASLKARGLNVSGVVVFGHPKTVIVDRAKSTGADFIFAGSHGSSTLGRFLLGSVAAGVLREAPCSIEIVRSAAREGSGLKVLLATDGSASSDQAAQSVAERPWPAGTEVRVLSAVELLLPAGYAFFEPPNFDTPFLESTRAESMKRSQDAIARAREKLDAAGLKTTESVSVLMEPARTIILNEATEWGADLIVLGSHGHRGIDRLLLGSVSEAVAMHAGCSVEVIRARATR
jgi:nucleotide-binding universal stress UspA family protein